MENNDTRQEQIDTGIVLIKNILKKIKKPASVDSLKELKSSVDLLAKKAKMLKKDELLRVQYLDRTAFDTIQGVFQAFHLYIISDDSDEMVGETLTWLRSYEDCYAISERMKAAANNRADFVSGAKK